MIPELGSFALILALCVSVVQAIVPLWGSLSGRLGWVALAAPAAQLQAALVALSYGCLTWGFIVDDFSVLYVANTSNTELPFIYRISGVWGAHEGSLLLWALILSVWTCAVSLFSRGIPRVMLARVLSVMAMVSVGFLLFILLTSNPFERLFPVPIEGRDLNPLLQDFGLAIHPPMLYMGYVGIWRGHVGCVLGRHSRGHSSLLVSAWVVGGLTTNWAGAVGGFGIRLKMRL